jgi:hypothetical protein
MHKAKWSNGSSTLSSPAGSISGARKKRFTQLNKVMVKWFIERFNLVV